MTSDYGSPNNGPYYPNQPQPVQPQGPVQYPPYQAAPAPAQPMPPYQSAPAPTQPMPAYQPAPAPTQPMPAYQPAPAPTQPMPAYQPAAAPAQAMPTQPMPPYQPGYGGYGGYGQPPQMPPQQPPKGSSKPLIITVIVLVVAIIAALVVWLIVRNNNPTPPPAVTTSVTVPQVTDTEPTTDNTGDSTEPTSPDDGFPTDFGSVVNSPFCNAYVDFNTALLDWDSYQSAVDSNDYATADGYMVNFLATAKAMQAAGPSSDMKDAVNTIVDYFTKVHAALQKGNMSGVSQTDYANYSLALLTVAFGGLSECYS